MSTDGWKKYNQLNCIGTGAFGQVFLVEGNEANGGPAGRYVIKRVQVSALNQKELKDAVNEVFILRMLDHPNIINYCDHFVDPEGYLNIVMEYCAGGDLNGLIEEQKKGGADNYLTEDQVTSSLCTPPRAQRPGPDPRLARREPAMNSIAAVKQHSGWETVNEHSD